MRFFTILTIVLCFQLVSAQTSLTILYTNNINGNFDNCLCEDHPLGSLEKIKVLVNQIRREEKNVIFVDVGDLFSAFGDTEKDSYVYQVARLMNYDAIAVGDQEFSNGVDFFLSKYREFKLPFINANLKIHSSNPWPAYMVKQYDSLNILIMAILDEEAFRYYPPQKIEGLQVSDGQAAIQAILRSKAADFIILLSHSGLDKDKKLAQNMNMLDLILGAHTQDLLMEPLKINHRTLISHAGSDGAYLGKINVEFNADHSVRSIKTEMLPINLDLPNDSDIVNKIKEYYYKRNEKIIKREDFIQPVPDEFLVLSASYCTECHHDYYSDWQKSVHARSYLTIEKEGKVKLRKCLACHVSGWGRSDGFVNVNLTKELAAISCTECHFLKPGHLSDPGNSPPLTISRDQCVRCHDQSNDPEFDYVEELRRIKHSPEAKEKY